MAHIFQFALEMGDAAADLSPVHFQLGFTGAAHTHSAAGAAGASTGLPRQVGPGPGQPGKPVFVLGQFHLHRALFGLGMAGENVQDQGRAIDHLDFLAHDPLNFALLPGRKLFIEDHDIGAQLQYQRLQFAQLAGADEGCRVGTLEPLGQFSLHFQARGLCQQGQFGKGVLHREDAGLAGDADADQDSHLLRLVGQDQALVIAHHCAHAAFSSAGEVIDSCEAA